MIGKENPKCRSVSEENHKSTEKILNLYFRKVPEIKGKYGSFLLKEHTPYWRISNSITKIYTCKITGLLKQKQPAMYMGKKIILSWDFFQGKRNMPEENGVTYLNTQGQKIWAKDFMSSKTDLQI